jgi:hypothetical protein
MTDTEQSKFSTKNTVNTTVANNNPFNSAVNNSFTNNPFNTNNSVNSAVNNSFNTQPFTANNTVNSAVNNSFTTQPFTANNTANSTVNNSFTTQPFNANNTANSAVNNSFTTQPFTANNTANSTVNNSFTTQPFNANNPNTNSFFPNSFTTKPVLTNLNNGIINSIPTSQQIISQFSPEPPRPLTRHEILDKEITDAIRDIIHIFQKCKIKTDDINNENERGKMMKIIEFYYDSCNNQIVQLAFAEIYKGLKNEPYVYKIKYEDMDFDIPDFTYVCFRECVKKQFENMQYNINKYY